MATRIVSNPVYIYIYSYRLINLSNKTATTHSHTLAPTSSVPISKYFFYFKKLCYNFFIYITVL